MIGGTAQGHTRQLLGAQVHPVGVGPVHRITQDGDELDVGDQGAHPPMRVPVPEVERGALALQGPSGRRREQGFVAVALPDPLPHTVGVTGPLLGAGRPVAHEELGLLDRRQVQLRMLGQRGMQRGRACLRRPDDQEVWEAGPGLNRHSS